MTRPVLIGVVAAVLIVGGGAAYTLTKDDEKSSQTNSNNSSQENSSEQSNFSAQSTEGLEFKATITTTSGSMTTQATIEHDDKNNTRYVSTTSGQSMEIIYTSSAYYSCQGTNCVKFNLNQPSNSGFNPSDYTYDQSKLDAYKNGSTYKGQKSCPAGTCDVWSINTGAGTSTVYVDTKTKRISQVETSVNNATSKIVYDYTDVTINVPANAQAAPTSPYSP